MLNETEFEASLCAGSCFIVEHCECSNNFPSLEVKRGSDEYFTSKGMNIRDAVCNFAAVKLQS